EPQFRYPFFYPLPHGSQAWESLSDSPVTGAPWDFHPRCMTCPSYLKKYGINRTFTFNWSPDPQKTNRFESEESAFRQDKFFEKHQSDG
ncbi:MAG: hypothetical protein IJI66_10865, partial [Erysipelotrichaceae bacterium]|nr:hypothetical protein [Erysipelotrichaceae bacterium]